jgi:hypothetical protein
LLVAAGLRDDTALQIVEQIIGRGEVDPEPGGEVRLTPRAGTVLREAIEHAHSENRGAADTLDLLAVLLANEGIAVAVLERAGINVPELEAAIERRRG